MEPVKLIPAYKDYLWGGNKLAAEYGKHSDGHIIAESWELSTHPDGLSRIEEGTHAGISLKEYIEQLGPQCLGTRCTTPDLPVLVKLIDAAADLSIQVHPGDEYAQREEGDRGKTEMWLIVDCDPGVFLYLGFRDGVTREAVEASVENDTLTDLLQAVPVHKGDVFFIPAGTVHAIGKGIIICEIQQCSNVTYRLYDYGRTGPDGAKRPLHVRKALEVSQLSSGAATPHPIYQTETEGVHARLLCSCPQFTTAHYTIDFNIAITGSDQTFLSLLLLDGEMTMTYPGGSIHCAKGDSVFIPAQQATYCVEGRCEFVLVSL